jgi:hypothetical protein
MHYCATALCAGLLATVVVGGAFLPTPAEAAKTPSAEAVALKETTAACKAEAKEKKIRWPASRKIRERLHRQGCQTHASRTSEDCGQTGDGCLQGGGEG